MKGRVCSPRCCVALLGLMVMAHSNATGADLESEVTTLWQARLFDEAYAEVTTVLAKDADNAVAHRLLAQAYREGLGVTQDPTAAVMHLQRAAGGGDAEAMYVLGMAYAHGEGVAHSSTAALMWFERAAEVHPEAAYQYATIVLANQAEHQLTVKHDPIERLRFASSAGVAEAQYLLARLLLAGTVTGIGEESPLELLHAAGASVPAANTQMAVLAHQKRDFKRAKTLFEAAYEGGDISAAAYLGKYAEAGIEQTINRRRALEYYEAANGIAWAAEGAARIRRHQASIEVLGLRIYATTRGEITHALRSMGLIRLDGAEYWDAYDVSDLITEGPASLTVGYAPGSSAFVAELRYQFATTDARQARQLERELYDSLSQKYGRESAVERNEDVRARVWVIDATDIQLRSDARENRVSVTYQMRPFVAELRAYVEQKREQETGRLRNAF